MLLMARSARAAVGPPSVDNRLTNSSHVLRRIARVASTSSSLASGNNEERPSSNGRELSSAVRAKLDRLAWAPVTPAPLPRSATPIKDLGVHSQTCCPLTSDIVND